MKGYSKTKQNASIFLNNCVPPQCKQFGLLKATGSANRERISCCPTIKLYYPSALLKKGCLYCRNVSNEARANRDIISSTCTSIYEFSKVHTLKIKWDSRFQDVIQHMTILQKCTKVKIDNFSNYLKFLVPHNCFSLICQQSEQSGNFCQLVVN